jgi:hypothetical protein
MTENELETSVGSQERSILSAGSVTVEEVSIEPAKEGSKAKVVRLRCKHPEKKESIILSNIKIKKVQGNNETISKETLWWNLDDENKIRKGSNVAILLSFYNKTKLVELVGVKLETEHDANKYLCIKAY